MMPPFVGGGVLAWVVALALVPAAHAQMGDPRALLSDAQFADSYQRQYGFLGDASLVVLTEELRALLEEVAGRGSAVNITSSSYKVRGFERIMLREVKGALCGGGAHRGRSAGEPTPAIVARSVAVAREDSGLRVPMGHAGRVSAIAVRIVEKSDRARLCVSVDLSELGR